MIKALDNRENIYFADEACFTSAQSESDMWMLPGPQPALVPRNKIAFKAIAAFGVIDAKGNIVYADTTMKSYNSDKVLNSVKAFSEVA